MKSYDLEIKIGELKKQAEEIQKLAFKLIESAPLKQYLDSNEYGFDLLTEDLRNLQQDVITKYNKWYNAVYPLIKKYLPHQLDEFKRRYHLAKDRVFTYDITRILELNVIFLDGDITFIVEKFNECFTFQSSQLLSLKNIIKDDPKEHLGSLSRLEESLVQNIYDYLLKNPTDSHSKSRSITQQKKDTVKERDKCICQICEEKFLKAELEVDHIFPYSFGGSNQITNLMTLCKHCNADKGNRLEYYKSNEGNQKLLLNIKEFVKDLLLIQNFGEWLKRAGDKRRKNSALIKNNKIRGDEGDEEEYEDIYDTEEKPRRPNVELLKLYLDFFGDPEMSSDDLHDRLRRARVEVVSYRTLEDINEDEKSVGIKIILSINENLLIREERKLINQALEILYNLSMNDLFLETIITNCIDQLIQFFKEKKYYSYLLDVLDNLGYFTDILKLILQGIDERDLDLLQKLGSLNMSSYQSDGLGILKALQLKQKEISNVEENSRLKDLIRNIISRIEGLIVS